MKTKKKNNFKHTILAIIIAIIVIFVAFLFLDGGKFLFKGIFPSTKENKHEAFSVPIEFASQSKFAIFKDSIVIANKDGIKAVNKKGETEWSIPVTISNPILITSGKQVLVADKGGRDISVISNHSKPKPIKLQETILLARINEMGYIAVVTEEKGYKGKVTIYNPAGEEIYKWYSVENYIIDVDVSYDGKKMAVLTMDTSKGKVGGGVMFFYLNQEAHYAATVIEDALPIKIRFNRDNSLISICDNKILLFNKEGEKKWESDFSGRALKAFNIDSERMIVLALSEQPTTGLLNTSTAIEIVEMNGNKKDIYSINENIRSLDVEDDLIVINKKRDIIMLTKRGREIGKTTLTKDIDSIQLFQNKSQVMAVSKKELEILDMLK